MLKLNNLNPPHNSTKNRKRIGRGEASGQGKTSGKGHKGQLSRAGAKKRSWSEGGQMPIHRRLPKKGFSNPFRKVYDTVNIWQLNRFDKDTEVNIKTLTEASLISGKKKVKILGTGELKKPLRIKANLISETAKSKIEQAGGTFEVIS